MTSAGSVAVDVLVVGAGLAGLHTATLLAERGHEVLLVDRRTSPTGAIRRTGTDVGKTLTTSRCRRTAWARRSDGWCSTRRTCAGRSSWSGRADEYRVGNMAPLYLAAARNAADAGVRITLGGRDLALDRNDHLLVGAEEVFAVPPGAEPPTFHCVLDPSQAPGYLAGGGTPTSASPATPTVSPTASAGP